MLAGGLIRALGFFVLGKQIIVLRTKTLLLAACLCFFASIDCLAQEQQDFDWVNERFPAVLDEFLPLNKDTVISFRTNRDLYTDVLEYSCSFDQEHKNGSLEVVIRMADSVSLYDQIMSLHRKNPAESIESIKKQLKVKEWRLTEQKCPMVKTWYRKYEKLRVPLVAPSYFIVLHPMIYRFRLDGGSTGVMEMTLYDDEHPLAVWANNTRRALEKCIVGK